MDHCSQIVISGSTSSWKEESSGITQRPILGLVLFSVFINGSEDENKCMLYTKLVGVADTQKNGARFPNDLDKPEKLSENNPM